MTASCFGLLHSEGLLEILQCRICTANRTVHNKLLQLTVHNSVQNISYTKEFPAVLVHARNQHTEQSFYAITVFPNDGPVSTKMLGGRRIVNTTQLIRKKVYILICINYMFRPTVTIIRFITDLRGSHISGWGY